MAKTSLSCWRRATTILTITITSLALTHIALAMELDDHRNYGGVVTNDFMGLNPRSGSRFLAGNPKSGQRCDNNNDNVCSPDGTGQLNCCENFCRNVLSDKTNCGGCGKRCGFGQMCCNGHCTVVAYDVSNCGNCGNVCSPGLRCEYGSCGYA